MDLEDVGVTGGSSTYTEAEFEDRRRRLRRYVVEDTAGVWVLVREAAPTHVGMVICRFRDFDNEPATEANAFLLRRLDRELFPDDGRFTEIYQLWMAPQFRRQRLATRLKQTVEAETRRRGVGLIYTHTEAANPHVIDFNLKPGYREVRRGLLWDEVVRVSLTKTLEGAPSRR